MLLIDKLLFSAPVNGILWITEKIHSATLSELRQEEEIITRQLSKLYILLESGHINGDEFDEKENQLLTKLEQLQLMTDKN